jgi:hypothetical protein
MSRISARLGWLLILLSVSPVRAAFHEALINEVMSGAGGNPNVQYVEIKMTSAFQTAVGCTRLTAFNCTGTSSSVLLVVPSGVLNSGPNITWIMASPSGATFLGASGINADFTWNNGATGNIDPTCGMVCWGAPGIVIDTSPGGNCAGGTPNWNAADPNQYTDCVAYGGYSGTKKTVASYAGGPTSGTPSGLGAGNGTFSLTRMTATNNNSADFAFACPTPTNNASQMGSFGACTPPPPTETVATQTLLLKNPDGPTARKIKWSVKMGSPNGNQVNGDPQTSGATLKVQLDATSQCFDMPGSGWSPISTIGFKYADASGANGPVKVAQIKKTPGGVFKLKFIILSKNGAVNVVPPGTQADTNFFIRGGGQYCGSTANGTINPNDAKTLKATSPAPAACNVTACP